MVEIYTNLFIGDEGDGYSVVGREGWAIVHAAKEPFHREALGYTGRAAPKEHAEYLIARRGERLILNLVDAPDPAYIPQMLLDEALKFIHERLAVGRRVLVHCNQGESRAPTIGLLYLVAYSDGWPFRGLAFDQAEEVFREIYPAYAPGAGMRGAAKAWLEAR